MSQSVLLQRDGGVATLILNRPERMNALDLDMWRRLAEAVREVAGDPALRCLVVRGADARAFAAGADLAEFQRERATPTQAEAYGKVMIEALHGLRDLELPTLAAIRGACIGGGLEIAMMCDLRIATADAKFGIPIQRLGVVMPYPELMDLVELVGRATALEILLEGRIFEAAEAMEKGLLTRVVSAESWEAEIAAAIKRLVEGAPSSHRFHKKMARRLIDPRPLTPREIAHGYSAAGNADYQEGVRAFMEKRKPRFGD